VTKLAARLCTLRTRRDDGASAVEYGLLVALIAVVISVAIAGLSGALSGVFNDTTACLNSGQPC
jgi:pilus assembly protein Flp/PilA